MTKPKRGGGRSAWQKHVDHMRRRLTPIRCLWCALNPGQTHRDLWGMPLFDARHHSGQYVTPEESDRIAQDGP